MTPRGKTQTLASFKSWANERVLHPWTEAWMLFVSMARRNRPVQVSHENNQTHHIFCGFWKDARTPNTRCPRADPLERESLALVKLGYSPLTVKDKKTDF